MNFFHHRYRSKRIDISVYFRYEASDGTAKDGSDYTAKKGKLTFKPNEKTKKVEIEILDDNLAEKDETFNLKLFKDPKNVQVDIGKKNKAEITIINDDGMYQ